MPESKIPGFSQEFQKLSWQEVSEEPDLDLAVSNFHRIIVSTALKHFPEEKKTMKISS